MRSDGHGLARGIQSDLDLSGVPAYLVEHGLGGVPGRADLEKVLAWPELRKAEDALAIAARAALRGAVHASTAVRPGEGHLGASNRVAAIAEAPSLELVIARVEDQADVGLPIRQK
jgi:hypothetical protein